jgi:hypothetical protein
METKLDDQAEAIDLQERLTNILEAEDALTDEEEIEEEVEESEESEEDSEEEEKTEEEEAEESLIWNGEEKKVTKTELKELAQKGFDYTAKTQVLAEERRILAIERQTLQAQTQIQEKALDIVGEVKAIDRQLQNYQNVDWTALAEQDPVEYLKHNHAFRELKETRQAKVQEFQGIQQYEKQMVSQFSQERLVNEAKRLAEKIPEFRDAKKASETKASMVGYLEQRGFNQAEIDNIVDSRMVEVIYDALRYKGLSDTKPAMKKRIEAAPKSVKPGSAQNVSASKNSELAKRLKQTGRDEYAAKLIENML